MKIRAFYKYERTKLFCFCLIVSVASITGCKKSPTDNGENIENTPRTSVPEVLTGEWQTGTISSINFFNSSTGAWGTPSGTGIFFKFSKDGYYEKGVLLQSTLYGHTMTFFAYNKGTMTVEDNVIIIYPTYGRIKSIDNMVQENNYEKADDLTPETMYWEVGTDEFGYLTLWLSYQDSNPSAFHQPE